LELSDTYVIDHDTKDYRPGEVGEGEEPLMFQILPPL
jgi:hypothetical protein